MGLERFVVALLGVLLVLHGRRTAGARIAVGGVAWFLLCFFVVACWPTASSRSTWRPNGWLFLRRARPPHGDGPPGLVPAAPGR